MPCAGDAAAREVRQNLHLVLDNYATHKTGDPPVAAEAP
jgi:hypothetical protein